MYKNALIKFVASFLQYKHILYRTIWNILTIIPQRNKKYQKVPMYMNFIL